MHSWSSSLPVVHSLCLSGQFPYRSRSSGTLLYAKTPLPYLWHFTCQQTPLNTCILIQHLRVQPCMEQIPYVHFPLPHVCLILPYFHIIIPHACCPSLPIMFQFFQYISIEYLSCISSVLNIKSSSPLLSHFVSEVHSLGPKSRAHRWQVAQHIQWGLALIC